MAAASRPKRRVRPLTKDGYGTKLYLVATELSELRLGPPYPLPLQRKLQGAIDRIERRRNG